MKWVRCVYNFGNKYSLTIGKLYEVFLFENSLFGNSDSVTIYDDYGLKSSWFIKSGSLVWFEDATTEIRDNRINKILDL